MKHSKLLTFSFILLLSSFQLVLNAQNPAVRHVPDSVVNSYKNAKGYEYANDPAYWKKAKPSGDSGDFFARLFNPIAWKFIGYLFLITIFGIVIYRLISNGVFYRKRKSTEQLQDYQQENELDENALTASLKEFQRDGRFREAIRAHYLLTLIALDRTGLIKLEANSTNHDYSDQLKNHKAYSAFAYITRMYEYAWFGHIKLSPQDYAFAEKRFTDFKKQF
ncbi:MAG TPA: hypothetical protein VLC28_08160 [Flavitalea sp.]|nr:hypothetical protein [Flavitalea sp.]